MSTIELRMFVKPNHIHSVVPLTIGPQPLPKRVSRDREREREREKSSASPL